MLRAWPLAWPSPSVRWDAGGVASDKCAAFRSFGFRQVWTYGSKGSWFAVRSAANVGEQT